MSWCNVISIWVIEDEYEELLQRFSCSFEAERVSATNRTLPKHIISLSKATFDSHEYGGWNYNG